ncbi:MAG: hypothetical protein IJU76_07275 [Desulfovibrionaceae bacterium]|nr:hypothetical protein [Desulfovibrionaceae bacterium]
MRLLAILSLVLFCVAGCASKYGEAHTHVQYYPACYRPLYDLRRSETVVQNETAGGAIFGALGGALLGFLSTGKVEGAIVGGVAGAATGAVIGNMAAKKQKIRDENRRLASYLEDLEGDIHQLDIVSASAKTTLDCYENEFQILLNDIKTRRITRREAEERFAEIASGRDEAIALLGRAETYGQDLDHEYDEAFRYEEKTSKKKGAKTKMTQVKAQKKKFSDNVRKVSQQKKDAVSRKSAQERDFSARLEEIDA